MAKSRAWVFLAPEKMETEEFEIPAVAEDCALLKVEACGICGTDKHIYLGHAPKAPFPFIAGHEIIGTVEKLGGKANESMNLFNGPLKTGDRVALAPSGKVCGYCYYCRNMPHRPAFCPNRNVVYGFTQVRKEPSLWGGYAEYIYVLPGSNVFKIPEGMSLERAILIEPISTAVRAVERAYSPGEPFLGHGYGVGRSAMVLGAGPIGLMVVAALRDSGAGLIIAQDLFSERLDKASKLGADMLIDGRLPIEERLEKVKEATEGVGPDVLIEAAGSPHAFREALDFVRRGGKLIEVGNFTNNGPTEIIPFYICNKDLDIHGSWGYPALIFKDAISMLERTSLPVEEAVTHTFPLEELPKAMEVVGARDAGKVVITP
jgi:L-iditol 2-dehydrogenase